MVSGIVFVLVQPCGSFMEGNAFIPSYNPLTVIGVTDINSILRLTLGSSNIVT